MENTMNVATAGAENPVTPEIVAESAKEPETETESKIAEVITVTTSASGAWLYKLDGKRFSKDAADSKIEHFTEGDHAANVQLYADVKAYNMGNTKTLEAAQKIIWFDGDIQNVMTPVKGHSNGWLDFVPVENDKPTEIPAQETSAEAIENATNSAEAEVESDKLATDCHFEGATENNDVEDGGEPSDEEIPVKVINMQPTKNGAVRFYINDKSARVKEDVVPLFNEWYAAFASNYTCILKKRATKPLPFTIKTNAQILPWLLKTFGTTKGNRIIRHVYVFDTDINTQVIPVKPILGVSDSNTMIYGDIEFKPANEINEANEGLKYLALYPASVRPSNRIDPEEWLARRDAANRAAAAEIAEPADVQTPELIKAADRFEAIKIAESKTTAFFIDSYITRSTLTVGQITALNNKCEVMTLADEYLEVANSSGHVLFRIEFDVPESAMIAALEPFTDIGIAQGEMPETFDVTGKSGAVYTYSEKTLEVINVAKIEKAETVQAEATPIEKPVLNADSQALYNNLIAMRDAKQAEIEDVLNGAEIGGLVKANIKLAQLAKINARINAITTEASVA